MAAKKTRIPPSRSCPAKDARRGVRALADEGEDLEGSIDGADAGHELRTDRAEEPSRIALVSKLSSQFCAGEEILRRHLGLYALVDSGASAWRWMLAARALAAAIGARPARHLNRMAISMYCGCSGSLESLQI